jgi:UPF0755 protein
MTEPASPHAKQQPAEPPGKPERRKRRGVFALFIVLVLLAALVSPFLVVGAIMGPGPLTAAKTLVIPHGTSIREIADMLEKNGIVSSAFLFRGASRFMASNDLKAGEYQFDPEQSIADIILKMREGDSVVHSFTVTEGLTSAEAVRLLKDSPALTGEIATVPVEGSILPETYTYNYGDTRAGMIARMQKGMQEALDGLWAKRDPAVPLKSPQEAVTMASIVEK